MDDRAVPLRVRVKLAHAHVQAVADEASLDVLHIKGPAVATGLRSHDSSGSDVDILVRPVHVSAFMTHLLARGWSVETEFTSGSAFDHAANLYHPDWGLLDVHRSFPGMDRDPARTFEVLWAGREEQRIAAFPCPVPDRTAQSLVLLLHAARSVHGLTVHPDVAPNWEALDQDRRDAIEDLAQQIGAQVGLAAATNRLDLYADEPEAALWRWFRSDGSRLEEWQARWQAAPTLQAKVSVAARSVRVNRYYLRWKLGHEPTRTEVATEFVRRLGQATREGTSLVQRRLTERRRR